MKRSIMTLAITTLLVSCNDGRGTLSINEKLTFNGIKDKKITLNEGDYRAKIDYKKNIITKRQRLLVKVAGEKRRIEIDLPKGLDISKNTSFSLKSSEIGQSFGLKADVETKYTRSETEVDIEDCTVTEYIKRCVIDRDGDVRIVTDVFDVPGLRKVRFHFLTEDQRMRADFSADDSDAILASFTGGDISTSKIYEYQGMCLTRYSRPFPGYDYTRYPRPRYRRAHLPRSVRDCYRGSRYYYDY